MLQCVAVCCNVLQCVAVRCSVVQFVAACCSMLQRVAPSAIVCDDKGQYRSPHCSVLQCVAVCCRQLHLELLFRMMVCVPASPSSELLSNTVSCSMLQCVSVCCSALQCVAVCCSVLQCAAVSIGTPRAIVPNDSVCARKPFAHSVYMAVNCLSLRSTT